MQEVRFRASRRGDKWIAVLQFPTGDGPHGQASVVASGGDEDAAVLRAAEIADKIASNPIFQAVAPPGTAAAIKAVRLLAANKNVRRVVSRFAGPGARRLRKVFGF